MVLLADKAQVKAFLVHLEKGVILMQDRCTICIERAVGSDIILDSLDGTPRSWGYVESCFFSFGDSVSVSA
jgi:hypothetical protein